MDAVGRAEVELYRLAPEDFVAERDAHVARAKEAGDRDAAKAIAALRRPSRAAWLTNLLVHDRPDEVEGLLGLADTLAAAQRSLDGTALRTISAQRSKLVGALSRQAAALGREAGYGIESTLEREVRTILESALADPELAERVRSGRLVKAEKHAGFGPAPDEGAEPMPARPTRGDDSAAGDGDNSVRRGRCDSAGRDRGSEGRGEGGTAGRERAEPDPAQARLDREITRAQTAFNRSHAEAERARERHAAARADAEQAERGRDESRDRVAELSDALEQARTDSAAANRAAHAAATAEKEAARAARSAETARDRAENAYRELQGR